MSELVTNLADAGLKHDGTPIKVQLGEGGPTSYLPLGEVAPLVRRVIAPAPDATYTELGVRSFNKGTFHRRTVKGTEFTWQELYLVRKNDLVFSNIMAWEGAVALAGTGRKTERIHEAGFAAAAVAHHGDVPDAGAIVIAHRPSRRGAAAQARSAW